VFGSCWGLQVLTVAAGGGVRKNPKGREIGFGRRIKLTEPGRKHPMYVGKPEVFNAPTVHLDEVETVAPGTTVLATNEVSDVQSAEIRVNGAVAWGVQYHPEYPLREIAAIVRRIGLRLIDEGFSSTPEIATSPTTSYASTAIRPRSGCRGATASARTCWTKSFAPARWRTGSNTRCCRPAPSAGAARARAGAPARRRAHSYFAIALRITSKMTAVDQPKSRMPFMPSSVQEAANPEREGRHRNQASYNSRMRNRRVCCQQVQHRQANRPAPKP
jgi:hypothetical protein